VTGGASLTPPGSVPPMDPSQDYDLDITHCIERAWRLLTQHFWLVVGTTILVMVLVLIGNQLLGLFSRAAVRDVMRGNPTPQDIMMIAVVFLAYLPVQGILTGGLYAFYLRLMRTGEAEVGNAFAGFGPSVGNLALVVPLTGLLTML